MYVARYLSLALSFPWVYYRFDRMKSGSRVIVKLTASGVLIKYREKIAMGGSFDVVFDDRDSGQNVPSLESNST